MATILREWSTPPLRPLGFSMPRFPNYPASRLATIFVVAVCLIIAGLEAWSTLREREIELQESTRATSNTAMALAQHADQTFNEIDIILQSIQERLEKDGFSEQGLERTHEFMAARVAKLPQLSGLFFFDETGKWIVNSQPMLETRFNNADRDYFLYHQQHRTDKPFIGEPVQGKVSGQWTLTISRRFNKPDGTFGGVVLGAIDVSYLQRFYAPFDIGQKGAIMLGRNDGTVFFRRPLLADSIGKKLDHSPLFQQHVKNAETGSVEIPSTQDGVVRVNSFRHLTDHPLFIIVAISREEILQKWTGRTIWRLSGVAIVLLLIGYGGSKMVRQIYLRERAEMRANEAQQKSEDLHKALEDKSQRDGLTDAFNRRYFDDALIIELAQFSRRGGDLSVLVIDIDHFKLFNDTYGHAAGDQCLRLVAKTVMRVAREEYDVVARYEGEKFAVMLPGRDKAEALSVAQGIARALREESIAHERSAAKVVTVSIGVTSIASGIGLNVTMQELIESADSAVYLAKTQGRDQIIVRDFHPDFLSDPMI